ncbi:hypothetical protein [Paraburkholderia kururiensis]|uniref:hypothetical protein n=1 Tax=Paraburkholderia kururiensis TaxID=984307 RepID=UPI0003697744|nr:hypothetical protein [Paraburkholderia kururiensis]
METLLKRAIMAGYNHGVLPAAAASLLIRHLRLSTKFRRSWRTRSIQTAHSFARSYGAGVTFFVPIISMEKLANM